MVTATTTAGEGMQLRHCIPGKGRVKSWIRQGLVMSILLRAVVPIYSDASAMLYRTGWRFRGNMVHERGDGYAFKEKRFRAHAAAEAIVDALWGQGITVWETFE